MQNSTPVKNFTTAQKNNNVTINYTPSIPKPEFHFYFSAVQNESASTLKSVIMFQISLKKVFKI